MTKKVQLGLRYLYHLVFTRFQSIGWKVVFQEQVTIRNSKNISLGSYVSLDKNVLLQVINRASKNTSVRTPKLLVKNRVGIGANSVINCAESIVIEDNVMIGPSCTVIDYEHKYSDVAVPINQQGLHKIAPITIKEGAWITSNVTVCPGVTIGKNAVVGANSLVNKDIPDFSLAVGCPARVIKTYDTDTGKWVRI